MNKRENLKYEFSLIERVIEVVLHDDKSGIRTGALAASNIAETFFTDVNRIADALEKISAEKEVHIHLTSEHEVFKAGDVMTIKLKQDQS